MFSAKSASSVNLDHYCNKTDIHGLDFVFGWLVKHPLKIQRYNLTVPFLTMNSTDDPPIETHRYTFCNL
jgi:phenolic acid decarboxylase